MRIHEPKLNAVQQSRYECVKTAQGEKRRYLTCGCCG
jgi:hypothetical protein